MRAIRSTADVRLFGAPGTVAKFAARLGGNNMHDTPTTTIISGHRMRTESGNTATIIDADAGRIITIDTKEQTDTFITFDEMAAAMRRAEKSAKAGRDESLHTEASRDANAPKGDVNVTYRSRPNVQGSMRPLLATMPSAC